MGEVYEPLQVRDAFTLSSYGVLSKIFLDGLLPGFNEILKTFCSPLPLTYNGIGKLKKLTKIRVESTLRLPHKGKALGWDSYQRV